jgi:glutaminyl-peptide cyclotransferase
MRPLNATPPLLLAISLLLGAACSPAPSSPMPAVAPPDARLEGRAGAFSPDRAWGHLEALAAIGPRAAGTPGAEKARHYLSEELAKLGLAVGVQASKIAFEGDEAGEPIDLMNLEVTIPGASPDLIVLAAPYDSAYHATYEYRGVNDGASGAALLLEVARVVAADPLPYTVRLVFLDAESPLGRGSPEDAETRHIGSTAAADRMATDGTLAKIRLLLLINRVSDADLRIARDRFSHRTYRDVIWRTAADIGHDDVFAPGSSFDAPLAGHRSFNDRGMRRTVAIVDPHFGAGDLPEAGEHAEDDSLERSSPESLQAVGEVVLASLEVISAWLGKIDRFSEAPVLPEPEPEPEAEAAPESASDPELDLAPAPEPASNPEPEAEGADDRGDEAATVSEPASEPEVPEAPTP